MHDQIPQVRVVQYSDVAYRDVLDDLPQHELDIMHRLLHAHQGDQTGAVVVCACPVDYWFAEVDTSALGDTSGKNRYRTRMASFDRVGAMKCPPEDAGYKIGRSMFETDSVPEGWVEKLNRMDAIWVPSKFNARTFARAGVDSTKIVVLPEAVDTERLFNPKRVSQPYDLIRFKHRAEWLALHSKSTNTNTLRRTSTPPENWRASHMARSIPYFLPS